jgi:hypothetical protein
MQTPGDAALGRPAGLDDASPAKRSRNIVRFNENTSGCRSNYPGIKSNGQFSIRFACGLFPAAGRGGGRNS